MKKKNGRKISSKFENPIDDKIIELCDSLVEICYKNNITPNLITIIRIIIGFFNLYYLFFTCNSFIPIIGTAVFYFMDCLDGHLARSTDQVTVFGDYLDHYADLFYYFSILVFMIIKKYSYKFLIIPGFLLLSYSSFVHLGLQQKNYKIKTHEELLDKLNCLHNLEPNNITWTRYFGTGTLYLTMLFIIYYIKLFCL
jgi:phosphatidylglycerophosphate synthase